MCTFCSQCDKCPKCPTSTQTGKVTLCLSRRISQLIRCKLKTVSLVRLPNLVVKYTCAWVGVCCQFSLWGMATARISHATINHLIGLLSCWWLLGFCFWGFSTQRYTVELSALILNHFHFSFPVECFKLLLLFLHSTLLSEINSLFPLGDGVIGL